MTTIYRCQVVMMHVSSDAVHNRCFVAIKSSKSSTTFFFFNDPPPTEIYTLPLHAALPIFPSATEIVCALGMEDDLVAVTHECDYPDSVRDKPVLTRSVLSGASSGAEVDRHIRELVHEGSSIYALDAPLLEALRPDLILTQELCEVCAVSYPIVERAARRLGSSPQLVSLEPESLEDVFANIRFIGRLVGRADSSEPD